MTLPLRRVCLWSGPRNVSTALMYAFAQRPDTRVLDEPLYAHYLRVSGAIHPGRELVLTGQDTDGQRVVDQVIMGASDHPVLFVKTMAHHLVDLDLSFLERTINIILTRDPREMLPSLINQIPNPTARDTALPQQVELLSRLKSLGQHVPVLDAKQLLLNPHDMLQGLCPEIGLEFHEEMMSWNEGARPEDGVWAPMWYQNVHKSRGFQPYAPKTIPFPARLEPLYEEVAPMYGQLMETAVRVDEQ